LGKLVFAASAGPVIAIAIAYGLRKALFAYFIFMCRNIPIHKLLEIESLIIILIVNFSSDSIFGVFKGLFITIIVGRISEMNVEIKIENKNIPE
jgi:hypothetical protein